MAKTKEVKAEEHVSLASLLSTKSPFTNISFWIVGDTPIITHAWSHKAKMQMLQKQVKATKSGKEARDPHQDFVDSLYDMGDGTYGFPVTGIKNCILSAAHKDKGIAKTDVMKALWMNAEIVRVRPALAGAICDMPLVRIYGSKPEMREDMVKIGAGLNKVANLAYRAQFTFWAFKVTGRINPAVITPEALMFLVQESGFSSGLGEWRNEKKGIFGSFHMATTEEEKEWTAFANGTGPIPVPENYRIAAE